MIIILLLCVNRNLEKHIYINKNGSDWCQHVILKRERETGIYGIDKYTKRSFWTCMSFPVLCGRWGNLRRIRRPRMKIKNKISHNFTIAPTGFEFTLHGYHHRLIKGFFTGISKVKVPPTTLFLSTMRVRNGKNERPHRGARGFIIFSRYPHTYIHIWCAPKACGQKKGFWKKNTH